MIVLSACKNALDPFKNENTRVSQHFSHFIAVFQTLNGSLLRCLNSDLVEIQTHLSFYGSPCYLHE